MYKSCLYLFVALLIVMSGASLSAKDSPLSNSARNILKAKCADCHSSKAELPFYANVPFFSTLIKKDIEDGLADLDLERDLAGIEDKDVDDGILIHLETVLSDNTMPPIQYGVIHWDKYLSKKEKATLVNWINEVYKLKGM